MWKVVTLAAPVSVILKRISVFFGAYALQSGVTLVFKALWFGFSVLTMLRKDPANDASIGVAALDLWALSAYNFEVRWIILTH